MLTTKAVLILSALTVMSYAQITNGAPAVIGFVDLSTSSGTQILVLANQENIVTTVGNALFPAGNVRIGNNGVAVAGVTSGFITGSNTAIPPAGVPIGIVHPGLGGGTAPNPVSAILAFWDDLYTTIFATPPASVWWKEQNDVLYIMWKNEYHTFDTTPGQNITFEIQVFGSSANGAPVIQILYPDTTFGGSMAAFDHGSSATVGYVKGSNPFGSSAQWSFNTASVPDGTVLSIYSGMYLAPSSPLGPGSIQVSLVAGPPNGSYFLAVTLAPGAFPNGWLFGLDISYADLAAQLAGGFPFAGPLDPAGNVNIGPFQGLPPITTYAVAFGFLPGSPVPSLVTAATAHPIP